jgi:hypothetical protein
MTVGELRFLLRKYDDDTHVAIVWPREPVAPGPPYLAEIEKLVIATEIETGEVDVFLEANEILTDLN